MSRIRILQAWVIISAALLWSASVVAAQDEAHQVNEEHENNDDDDEAGAPAIQIALRPQIQGTMQFVTEEEMMNRFGGDNTTTRFEGGLRGSSSSSPPPPVPSLPAATSSLPQHYIINGEDADAGDYPWFAQAIIRFKNGGFMLGGCGAVLIAPDWIATAAHCVDGPMRPWAFEVGVYCPPPFRSDNCGEKREFGKVKAGYIHEEYEPTSNGSARNDIALFQLEEPIESIEPIQVDTGHVDLSHGTGLTAIGIGLMNQKKRELAPVLQEVDVRYVDPDLCKVIYRDAFEKKEMICAGEQDRGTCGGDSGGPLFQKNTLVGLTSFGAMNCGLIPDVYTSIAGTIDWIRSKVCSSDSTDPPSWCSGSSDKAASSGSPASAAAADDDGEEKDQKNVKKNKDK